MPTEPSTPRTIAHGASVFRYIPIETHSAALNMALDEACMDAVRNGHVPPTIRLYHWSPSAVTIGNFQCLSDEVDMQACNAGGVAVVRRQTGGGAVYHDSEGEVTYSIIGPTALFSSDITESHREICACLIDAFAMLGIHAEFRAINDLVIDGRKVSGNAQTRRGGVFLQHGTILLSVDAARMFTLLTPDKSKITDKPFIKSVNSAVTGLLDHENLSREAVETALSAAFQKRYHGVHGSWTEEELAHAHELVKTKYDTDAWNAMR